MRKFTRAYEAETGEKFLDEKDPRLIELDSFLSNINASQSERTLNTVMAPKYAGYLQHIQAIFREKWSTFNITYCLLGILLLLISILIVGALEVESNKIISEEVKFEVAKSGIVSLTAYFAFFLIVPNFDYKQSIWIWSLLFDTYIIFNSRWSQPEKMVRMILSGLCACILKRRVYFIYFATFLIPFSNSYIIMENVSLRFLLQSVMAFTVYVHLQKKTLNTKAIIFLVTAAVFVRKTDLFYTCREEARNCFTTPLAQPLSKSNIISTYGTLVFVLINFAVFGTAFYFLLSRHLTLIKTTRDVICLQKQRWLNSIYCFQFILILCYWLAQIAETQLNPEWTSILKLVGLALSRSIYILIFVCFSIIQRGLIHTQRSIALVNYIFCVGIFLSVLAGESLLSIWVLIYLIIISKLLFDHNQAIKQDLQLIYFMLLQHYFFYASGHETNFTHIKWQAAFHGFSGETSGYWHIRTLMGAFIILNTFSSTILCSLASPFIFQKKGVNFKAIIMYTLKVNYFLLI
jgi:hypothetical protein